MENRWDKCYLSNPVSRKKNGVSGRFEYGYPYGDGGIVSVEGRHEGRFSVYR